MTPSRALSIEPSPEITEALCADCGRHFSSVHGFIYDQGDAHAVYHALLQTEHPSAVADIAVSLGRWDEDASAHDRRRIGFRVWPEGDELKMHVTDPTQSSWGDSDTFGRMFSRGEVLGTPVEEDALESVEFVIAHDPRVAEHLR